ncbi:MAG: FAD-dependent oxidoreductase, partial [Planctomycetota bacterium]
PAGTVVIATESDAASRLLEQPGMATPWSGTTTLYFASPDSPDDRKMLILRGDETGPVQTVSVMSDVAPEYAPAGESLVSVSVSAESDSPADGVTDPLEASVREQLGGWFAGVDQWRLLRSYRVPFGLPKRDLDPVQAEVIVDDGGRLAEGLYVCGDHRESPSIQGAMNSGMRVAELICQR